jgi:hypothetical protein
MKAHLRYRVILLPTALFFTWWMTSAFAYDYLGCHGSKGLPQPCVWEGVDVEAWLCGIFFGQFFFFLSLPFAVYFCLDTWLKAYRTKLNDQARGENG